jgi:hypothetical protein
MTGRQMLNETASHSGPCLAISSRRRYSAVQSGQAHQLANFRPGAGHLQATAVRGSTVRRADQRSEPDGVDKANLFQVDRQRGAAGCHIEKALAQRSHGGNVDLPGGGHDRAALFVPDLDGQCLVHGQPPSGPSRLSCPGPERLVLTLPAPGYSADPFPPRCCRNLKPLPWPPAPSGDRA